MYFAKDKFKNRKIKGYGISIKSKQWQKKATCFERWVGFGLQFDPKTVTYNHYFFGPLIFYDHENDNWYYFRDGKKKIFHQEIQQSIHVFTKKTQQLSNDKNKIIEKIKDLNGSILMCLQQKKYDEFNNLL